ncbi:hypothetical protein RRG08_038406 [Elysia crispata]|uniref:Uncharacterized protein n=1 Tax=Elysia crispata TaxID=231223 RepID=A0AAE1DL55_9GAST|nr:hypothetical protein RRG08_038406 [Elysia crispata]
MIHKSQLCPPPPLERRAAAVSSRSHGELTHKTVQARFSHALRGLYHTDHFVTSILVDGTRCCPGVATCTQNAATENANCFLFETMRGLSSLSCLHSVTSFHNHGKTFGKDRSGDVVNVSLGGCVGTPYLRLAQQWGVQIRSMAAPRDRSQPIRSRIFSLNQTTGEVRNLRTCRLRQGLFFGFE